VCVQPKTMSEPHVVYHGDTLRLAGTTFDLHIHQRAETCSSCEPGCAQQVYKDEVREGSEYVVTLETSS
jgi:hypothetical protein